MFFVSYSVWPKLRLYCGDLLLKLYSGEDLDH
jgi:hypothetical protein